MNKSMIATTKTKDQGENSSNSTAVDGASPSMLQNTPLPESEVMNGRDGKTTNYFPPAWLVTSKKRKCSQIRADS